MMLKWQINAPHNKITGPIFFSIDQSYKKLPLLTSQKYIPVKSKGLIRVTPSHILENDWEVILIVRIDCSMPTVGKDETKLFNRNTCRWLGLRYLFTPRYILKTLHHKMVIVKNVSLNCFYQPIWLNVFIAKWLKYRLVNRRSRVWNGLGLLFIHVLTEMNFWKS